MIAINPVRRHILILNTGNLSTLALIGVMQVRAFSLSIGFTLIVKVVCGEVHHRDVIYAKVLTVGISFAELEDFWLLTDVKMSSLVTVSNTVVIACLV